MPGKSLRKGGGGARAFPEPGEGGSIEGPLGHGLWREKPSLRWPQMMVSAPGVAEGRGEI